ncbi:hypothetical protein CDL15_Pgr026250 [Punica granatum]|uniref:Uncharacterized protein n=1 Tax=Punica granatum TaxID=22663 RepID=A0A218VTV4_PUNGR|nr:hypothetical protein CDL15_Pgr026250 [Punica granatum]
MEGFCAGKCRGSIGEKNREREGEIGRRFYERSPPSRAGAVGFLCENRAGERGKAARERAGEASGGVSGERVNRGRRSRWLGNRGVSEVAEGRQ